ncbi:MAG: PAS domain-containing sensor histidine kinase [Desulfarculus sp.]|nr:PAS domain-containing sensor histidine kinase [Desulfarculus sp.]
MTSDPVSDPAVDCGQLWEIIQASRNKLKAAFDAIADPVCSVTPDLKVESLNLALALLAARHPRELVGLEIERVLELARFTPTARGQFLEAMAEVRASGRAQARLVETSPQEGHLFYEVTASPVLEAGGRVGLVIIQVQDVTEFKRMEQTVREYSQSLEEKVAERTRDLTLAQDQLREEKERLAQANLELRRLDALRHDLTNMVVHDMKGPLAEVMGNLDLISYEPLSDMQREALELASLGAEDLLRMIMNLLDIDRLEEGRLLVRPEPVLFADLAGDLLRKFQTLIRLKGIEAQAQDETAGAFEADPALLGRVLQNLLTNALGHTGEGGRVLLKAAPGDGGGVVLSVLDDGEGIPERFRDLIFQKFTQGSDGSGPRTSTGLGLTFCKMAVEAHGGRIWFDNQEGQGSTFHVWLPREIPE